MIAMQSKIMVVLSQVGILHYHQLLHMSGPGSHWSTSHNEFMAYSHTHIVSKACD